MGVKGLWSLLSPVARPIKLETMEGKRLAIDSSIWLYQFQATMRDKEGRVLVNAHVLGFLRRINKLLFHGIKPVFVFDGGAPNLKRSTIAERKRKKAGAAANHAKVAEKLFAAQMRREAVKQAQAARERDTASRSHRIEDHLGEGGSNAPQDLGYEPEEGESIPRNAAYLDELENDSPRSHPARKTPSRNTSGSGIHRQVSTSMTEEEMAVLTKEEEQEQRRKKFKKFDPYKLPDLPDDAFRAPRGVESSGNAVAGPSRSNSNSDTRGKASRLDPRLATEEELQHFIEEMKPEDLDFHSAEFRSLPTEIQYEIVGDLRIRSRTQSHKRLANMLRAAPTPMDFSRAQIANLSQRNVLTQQLLTVTDTIGGSGLQIPIRVASERNREYVLVRNSEADGGGWVLGVRDQGTVAQPIVIQESPKKPKIKRGRIVDGVLRREKGSDEEGEDDDEVREIASPTPIDPELRAMRQKEFLNAIARRNTPKKSAGKTYEQVIGANPTKLASAPLFADEAEENGDGNGGGGAGEDSDDDMEEVQVIGESSKGNGSADTDAALAERLQAEELSRLRTPSPVSRDEDDIAYRAAVAKSAKEALRKRDEEDMALLAALKASKTDARLHFDMAEHEPSIAGTKSVVTDDSEKEMDSDEESMDEVPVETSAENTPNDVLEISPFFAKEVRGTALKTPNRPGGDLPRLDSDDRRMIMEAIERDQAAVGNTPKAGEFQLPGTVPIATPRIEATVPSSTQTYPPIPARPSLHHLPSSSDTNLGLATNGLLGTAAVEPLKIPSQKPQPPQVQDFAPVIAPQAAPLSSRAADRPAPNPSSLESILPPMPARSNERHLAPAPPQKQYPPPARHQMPSIPKTSVTKTVAIPEAPEAQSAVSKTADVNAAIQHSPRSSAPLVGRRVEEPASVAPAEKPTARGEEVIDVDAVAAEEPASEEDQYQRVAANDARARSDSPDWEMDDAAQTNGNAARTASPESMVDDPMVGLEDNDNLADSLLRRSNTPGDEDIDDSRPQAEEDEDEDEDDELSDYERAERRKGIFPAPPEDLEEQEGGVDMNAEGDDYARFIAQIKGRNLDEVRQEIDNEIRTLNQQNKIAMRDSEDITHQMIAQIQLLLRLFGIPYITAPMEAEAQCAELARLNLVDGIITDDNDVFLFGGSQCFKNLFNDAKFVECFIANDLERELALTRERLITLAYLLGSDYTIGLPGVGPVVAMELLANFPGPRGLEEFKQWWLDVQVAKDDVSTETKFMKTFKKKFSNVIYIEAGWPNPLVRDSYRNPTVDHSDEPFHWGFPDLNGLRGFLRSELSWSVSKVDDELTPIVQRIARRGQTGAMNKQTILDPFFDSSLGQGMFAPRMRTKYPSKRLQAVIKAFREAEARVAGAVVPQGFGAMLADLEEDELREVDEDDVVGGEAAKGKPKPKRKASGGKRKRKVDDEDGVDDDDEEQPAPKKKPTPRRKKSGQTDENEDSLEGSTTTKRKPARQNSAGRGRGRGRGRGGGRGSAASSRGRGRSDSVATRTTSISGTGSNDVDMDDANPNNGVQRGSSPVVDHGLDELFLQIPSDPADAEGGMGLGLPEGAMRRRERERPKPKRRKKVPEVEAQAEGE